MFWPVVVLGGLVGLGVVLWAVGAMLPVHQNLRRQITLKRSPEEVFAVLDDLDRMPSWNTSVTKVERLPDENGKEVTRQTMNGHVVMTVITAERVPPSRLVRRTRDEGDHFEGAWIYDIAAQPGGCRVVLTEDSDVKSAMFRVMSRIFGQTKYMDQHLIDLGRRFGETVDVR